jgi:hypothetical protein
MMSRLALLIVFFLSGAGFGVLVGLVLAWAIS